MLEKNKPILNKLTINSVFPTEKLKCVYYSLFTFSWPRFESGSLRNGGMLILRIYFAVDSMPIEMYGESWIAGLLTSDDVMLYMAGFGMT